ncbi:MULTISPECIES: class I adenylate-forming enzyme family protein [unclassified Streptomyces]|uniref:class I adenylate-forming enzyme family protein n=1 Tax=unclassified Streptomyces TaxID=2593676 RepID=UPI000823A63C|nr:Acyl-CoA synthetases (AMP-forming)/AMP-acid ligases II [Streptomyces sp. AmelKG-E11A]
MNGPGDILRHTAARHGDRTALITADRTLTYTELDTACDRVAAALTAHGVRPGRTVSLYAQNRWEWIAAYHGALRAGAVVNPVNVMLTPAELAHVLDDCGSTAVFTSAEQAPAVLGAGGDPTGPRLVVTFGGPAEDTVAFDTLLATDGPAPHRTAEPDAPCTIGYTSGTTGHPKGAVQSHRAVLLNCALTATMHGRTEHDVVVTALPAPHVYGNVVINGTFLAGGTVVLMERFDAAEALRLIGEHRATLFEGVPAMYAMMLAAPSLDGADLSSLTRCTVGGQTMPTTTIRRWERRSGAPLIELWGMTEISGLGTTHAVHAPPLPGSSGCPCPVSRPGWPTCRTPPATPRPANPANSWSAARSSCSATTATPGPPPRRSTATAGCAPATSRPWTPPAMSSSSTGGRTWSSPAATTSTRRRSNASSPSTRPSRWSASAPYRTR